MEKLLYDHLYITVHKIFDFNQLLSYNVLVYKPINWTPSFKVDFFIISYQFFLWSGVSKKKVRKTYLFTITMYTICLNDGDNSTFAIKIISYSVYRKPVG